MPIDASKLLIPARPLFDQKSGSWKVQYSILLSFLRWISVGLVIELNPAISFGCILHSSWITVNSHHDIRFISVACFNLSCSSSLNFTVMFEGNILHLNKYFFWMLFLPQVPHLMVFNTPIQPASCLDLNPILCTKCVAWGIERPTQKILCLLYPLITLHGNDQSWRSSPSFLVPMPCQPRYIFFVLKQQAVYSFVNSWLSPVVRHRPHSKC
jgi:hypothetical protein